MDLTNTREIRTTLVVVGNFEIEDIAPLNVPGATFVTPTEGDWWPGMSLNRRWEVASRAAHSAPLADHVHDILDQLRGHEAKVLALAQRFYAYVVCVVYLYEAQGPECNLTPEMLTGIAALGADLGFDIYCLAGAEEQDE